MTNEVVKISTRCAAPWSRGLVLASVLLSACSNVGWNVTPEPQPQPAMRTAQLPPGVVTVPAYQTGPVRHDPTAITTAPPREHFKPLPNTVAVPALPDRPVVYGLSEPVPVMVESAPMEMPESEPQEWREPIQFIPPPLPADDGRPTVSSSMGFPQRDVVNRDRGARDAPAPVSVYEGRGDMPLHFPPPQHAFAPSDRPLDAQSRRQFTRPGSAPGSLNTRPIGGPLPRNWQPVTERAEADAIAIQGSHAAPATVGFPGPTPAQPRQYAPPARVMQAGDPDVSLSRAAAGPSGGPAAGAFNLGPGDVISMTVYSRPELDTTAFVSDRGRVVLPLIGEIAIAGMSPAEAAERIAKAYQRGEYLVDPQINVVVSEYRSQQISVLGEVKNPGRFPVETRLTVLDALALAGGVNELGGGLIYILRPDGTGGSTRIDIDLDAVLDSPRSASLFELRGGDSVVAPKAETFYIYGEVRQPNAYRLKPGMTVIQALSVAGGLTERGSDKRVQIKRKQRNGALETVQAELNSTIWPDDVIYVKERLF